MLTTQYCLSLWGNSHSVFPRNPPKSWPHIIEVVPCWLLNGLKDKLAMLALQHWTFCPWLSDTNKEKTFDKEKTKSESKKSLQLISSHLPNLYNIRTMLTKPSNLFTSTFLLMLVLVILMSVVAPSLASQSCLSTYPPGCHWHIKDDGQVWEWVIGLKGDFGRVFEVSSSTLLNYLKSIPSLVCYNAVVMMCFSFVSFLCGRF